MRPLFRSRISWALFGAGLFLAAFATRVSAETYYVATWGKDTHPGNLKNPFATLPRALTALRNQRGVHPSDPKPATIILRGGEYHLDKPIILYGADSNLTLTAYPGERAVLDGGRPVTQWRRESNGWWSAPLEGCPPLHLLLVNREARPWARLPQTGTFEHESVFAVPWMSSMGGGWKEKPTSEQLSTLRYKKGDLGKELDVRSAEVRVYHMWDTALVPLVGHDPKERLLTFGVPCEHPPGAFDVHRYAVYNVKEGMLSPGNWYQDRAAERLYYWPLPGETMETTEVVVPVMESILRLEGDRSRAVSRITVKGLTLASTNSPLGIGSFGAQRYPGVVEIQSARNCRFSGLQIVRAAGQGIRAKDLEDSRITDCDLLHSGACGLLVEGRNLRITGNRILHPGSVYPSAVGLFVPSGSRNVIAHNEVRSAPYDGMVVNSSATLVEGNLIEDVMRELHDGAGIYTGFCKGVTLRGNVVRDVPDTGGYGSSAYYIDERGEDDLVERNLSLNVARPSHNHMAKNCVIRGNVFITAGVLTLDLQRCDGFSLEGNVLVGKRGVLISSSKEALTGFGGNLLSPGLGRVEREFLKDYAPFGRAPWKPADNRIEDAGLDEESPDIAVVFEDFPTGRMGIDPGIFRKAGCAR